MTDIIGTLEQDLTVFASPNESGGSWKGGTATSTPLLSTVKTLLGDLTQLGSIGTAIGTVTGDIATALTDAADALNTIADALTSIDAAAQGQGSTSAQVLQALQNALAVTQSLVPGSSSALTSGSQFFGTLSSLLSDVGNDVTKAATELYQIAQQLTALASAFPS
jgi:methyl-accepting chemotaxis protein